MKTLFFLLLLSINSLAVGPQVWSVNSRADVLKGDARGVSIDSDGTITLAPKLTEIYKTGEQYIWSSAVDANGNVYLGTGPEGKIFRVTSGGPGSQLAKLAEMNVTALAIGKNGEIFAGTSPDGKVYRIDASGKADVYFEPKEKYIWSLAVMNDGSLAIGTGDHGVIYRVRSAGAARDASILFDTSETHVISLATDRQGNLYAGTDPGGIVMRLDASGKPFGLLDSPLREIHKIAVADDGSIYLLALGDSVSTPKSDASPAATPASITITPSQPEPPTKSRYDLAGAKSAVYHILSDGSTDLIWASPGVTGFSLSPIANGVLVGTSDKGRVYSVTNEGRDTLALQTDANQVSTLIAGSGGTLATSSNPGTLYHFGGDAAAEGTYESSVLDAKNTASWGRVWWRSNGNVTIQTRSGNTEKPNETWSAWSTAATDQKGVDVMSPKARYLQWRAVLKGNGASLAEVSVAFIPRNIAPEVLSINVLPTNVGLAANPPVQIDPNIALSGLDPTAFGLPAITNVPPRKIYQRGAVSLQWTAEDRNGDKLVYDVYYKEVGDATFKLLRDGISENFMTIDGQSLADGRYIFKVVAHDTPSNPANLALSGERITEPVDIDNTPPVVFGVGVPQIQRGRAYATFDAKDAASYLTRAEYSVNGGDWMPVYADDGISDSPHELYTIDVPLPVPGEYVITIRVYDVNGNAGNARVVVRK
jgi:sugar lactone lactonase YvrE